MARDEIAELIEAQIPALRRYAFALTRDREAGDDLVQDCLERALSRWRLRRAEGDLRAWLFTILRNLHLDAARGRRRRGAEGPFNAADEVAQPAEQERSLAARDALEALDRLPEEQKSLLVLIGVEDFSYAEAARVLGIPAGTVMSRLSRASASLRDLVETGRAPLLRRVK